MEKIITENNLKNFAYVNEGVCKPPVKGVVISFFGLGNTSMFASDTTEGEFYGEKGILYVVPYTNPWSWMNKQTVNFTDEILDVLFKKYGLNEITPVISSGESMGGQSALVYCAYSKRTPAACVVNCPVCDALYHYGERDDLPRTLYSALFNYGGTLEAALESVSPVHLVGKMPKIGYHVFHCEADAAVNISKHSDIFVKKMRAAGHSVTYETVPNRGHCDLTYAMKQLFAQYVIKEIENFKA